MQETSFTAAELFDDGEPLRETVASHWPLEPTLRAAQFGEIMSVILQSPRHSHVTVGALARQMLPAFRSDQYMLAKAQKDNSDLPAAAVGVAFWASVSEAVDSRITDNAADPIELGAGEWSCGNIVWLIDVVASPKVSAALLKSIRKRVGDDAVIKARVADPEGVTRIVTIE